MHNIRRCSFINHSSFRTAVKSGAPPERMADVIEGIPTFPSQRWQLPNS
jgi:hypothetical protein